MPAIQNAPTEESAALWWHRLFESAADAQLVCRRDGVVEKANPKAARLLRRAAPSKRERASLFPALLAADADRLAALLARRRVREETLRAVTLLAEGEPFLRVDLQVTTLGDGYSLVAIKDISRRLRLELHVQRLVGAIDATPDVFFLTDAHFHLCFVNPAFQTATGYTIEEVLGQTADFLRAPSEGRKVREYLESVRRGADWMGEILNRRRDGSSFCVEATISPLYDPDGTLSGFVSCERDITAKKRLQEEVLLERDFAQSIIHSLDSAVYAVDREFRLTHANAPWKQMPPEHGALILEGPPQIGRPLLEYVRDPARRVDLQGRFITVLAGGQPEELRCASADGRQWLVRISPWQHAGGVIGLIYNVTDQTRFHELQEQLLQAQKMETIGTLAAGVAHDFNNLLQAICGNVSLITLDSQLPEALRPRLDQIDLAARRAADITQQLLSFSRAADEQPAVLDLNQVVREASQLASRSLTGTVKLELQLASVPLKVRIDATRANQALLNLCVNAQDAMRAGGRLTLATAAVRLTPEQAARLAPSAGTEFARCSVTDTGHGIPPEILPRIFDSFFTTKEKGKGTGLGLYIVQRVVTQAGGFVEVESTVGLGATFHIYLPKVEDPLAAAKDAALPPLGQSSGRIMVVDDLDLVRDITKSFLNAAGFAVVVAANGFQALDLLKAEGAAVNLLFTDYDMPGMNGLELMQKVVAQWPHIKLVLASGYLEGASRREIEECGGRVLDKPFAMRDAIALISEVLAGKQARLEPVES